MLTTSTTSYEPIDQNALVLTATFVRDSLYETNDGPPISATPAVELMETVPIISELALVPEQHTRGCEEIRESGTYLSDVEREAFLSNCMTLSGRPASSTPVARAAALSEDERGYRAKAESISYSYIRRLQGYAADDLRQSEAALVEYGALAGGWANQMNNFAPIPPRFLAAHQRLQVALWELDAHTRRLATRQADIANESYAAQASRPIDAVNASVADYFAVVGLNPL